MTPAGRPVGPVPITATNPTMTDTGKAWDGAATKTRPTAALIAEGFHPLEQPPPERLNWKQNDQDRRLAVVDMIEARTFVNEGEGFHTGTGNVVGDYAFATWDSKSSLFHVQNTNIIGKSSDAGCSWSTDFTLAVGAVTSAISTRDDGGMAGATCAAYVDGGTARVAITGGAPGVSHAWATAALTGSGVINEANCVCPDPVNGTFLVGGSDFVGSSWRPQVWRVLDNHGQFVSASVVIMAGTASITSNRVKLVASSPTWKVAVGLFGGTTNLMWRWLDGDATSLSVTPPTTDPIVDLLWCPEDGVFLLIASSASHVVTMYTSPDGSGWSTLNLSANGTRIFATADAFFAGSAVRGSILMVPILSSANGLTWIMLSGDMGASWECLPSPLARFQSLTPVPMTERVRSVGPRFLAAGYSSAGLVAHRLTMRAG